MARNGWLLTFRADGSAKIVYGSSFGDEATAPANSFPIKEIYRLLRPHVIPKDYGDKSVAVFFRSNGNTPGVTVSLKDKAVIKKLFSDIKAKATPTMKERFEQLIKKRPLPGEVEEPPDMSGTATVK